METITFYSYKGGVGRTLALANVAIYLSRFGLNACLMDFDLESPGLHYKFPQFLETTDIKAGLVDYIYEFTSTKVPPESLSEFSIEIIPSSEPQGGIRLIPAGNVLSPDYWQKLASINWNSLFYEEDSEGIPFFLELKERIEKEFAPDFLLIDSRTGITEMSGLCTSLLPDKVVFLIVNNQENIEGARQILQSIQKVERFPGQKSIDVTFVLTRIPFSETDGYERTEKQIVKYIQDSLNKPVEDLESQLDVRDVCILHSDRELELSESLRLGQEHVAEETQLLRDYLRLFSRIIPINVVSPRLDNILDQIIDSAKLLDDADKVQRELEVFVTGYRYPLSLERLVNFYILRNTGREKILNAFHDLRRTFGTYNPKMLSKYISFFMKWDLYTSRGPNFEVEVIEEYLSLNPGNRTEVEMRLADECERYDMHEIALKHYLQLVDRVEEKEEILGKILDICLEQKFYRDATELFESYSGIIDNDISLRLRKLEILCEAGDLRNAQEVLNDGGATEVHLLDREPYLYSYVMHTLGREDEANEILVNLLRAALNSGDSGKLIMVGEAFYRSGKGMELERELLEGISSAFMSPSRIREVAARLRDKYAQESQHGHKTLLQGEQLTEQ